MNMKQPQPAAAPTGVTIYFRNRRKINWPDVTGWNWTAAPGVMALFDPWGRTDKLIPIDAIDAIQLHLAAPEQQRQEDVQQRSRPRAVPVPEQPKQPTSPGESFDDE